MIQVRVVYSICTGHMPQRYISAMGSLSRTQAVQENNQARQRRISSQSFPALSTKHSCLER
jgi:hypothetical protein